MHQEQTFHEELKDIMDEYVHFVYRITRAFPREELYGVTSQIRRASLSVILNYIEGYARQKDKVHKNFLEISYGSLQESKYLLDFSLKEKFFQQGDYEKIAELADRIGRMLWGILRKMDS